MTDGIALPSARRARGSTWTRSPVPRGLHPDLVRRLVALGLLDADRDAAGRAVVLARPARRRGPHPAAARRPVAQLRRPRPRPRPARPHRPTSRRPFATARDEHRRPPVDHEPADPEVPGGPARRPDQGAALRAHRGRRRAPAAGPARSTRGARAPAARARPAPTRTGCAPSSRPSSSRRPRVSGPGAAPGPGLRHPAAVPAARHRRARGQAAQGRVRLGRAPADRPARGGHAAPPPAGCCASRG